MLVLKSERMQFLQNNVNPQSMPEVLSDIRSRLQYIKKECIVVALKREQTVNHVDLFLFLYEEDFEEVEDLVPHKWYSREKWDGNPKGYWLVECKKDHVGRLISTTTNDKDVHELIAWTTHFMYIIPPRMEE